ncbi:MAG: hypothetical protein JNK72_05505 [Myxococcales bacterium]|nr:hypothetical protein [Myxococcales bacterium]
MQTAPSLDLLALPLPEATDALADSAAEVSWKVPVSLLHALQGIGAHAWELDAAGQWQMRRAAVEACLEALTGDAVEAARITDMIEMGTAQYIARRTSWGGTQVYCSP